MRSAALTAREFCQLAAAFGDFFAEAVHCLERIERAAATAEHHALGVLALRPGCLADFEALAIAGASCDQVSESAIQLPLLKVDLLRVAMLHGAHPFRVLGAAREFAAGFRGMTATGARIRRCFAREAVCREDDAGDEHHKVSSNRHRLPSPIVIPAIRVSQPTAALAFVRAPMRRARA